MVAKFKLLFLLGLLVPTLVVFKALFVPGTAVWGDAPYFWPEFIKAFPFEPNAWVGWGNNFGGLNQTLWLAPLMILYKLLNLAFGFNNDILIRLVFYFPAITLALLTPIFFARSLGLSKTAQFFASFFYVFNTYFLLLIDGGQVGVALAYGLFPLVLLFLRQLTTKPSFKNFLIALVSLSTLFSFDPRVGLIVTFSVVVWNLIEALTIKNYALLTNLKWLFLCYLYFRFFLS